MTTSDDTLTQLAGIIVLGVSAHWIAARVKLPAIILLLSAGLIAGPATGFLHPDELFGRLLFPSISLSVALVLFEGGLGLHLADLQGFGHIITRLCTIGAAVTVALTGAAAHLLLGLPWPVAWLVGAILVVTGPTVVGPLVTFVRPVGKIAAIARWEGIVIDPIGAMLATLVFEAVYLQEGGAGGNTAVLIVLRTLFAGTGVAAAVLAPIVLALRRYWIPDRLQSSVLLMAVIAAFTAANRLQPESGLLAVTLMGIALANQDAVEIRHIAEFKENLGVLLLAFLFVILAGRLSPAELHAIGWREVTFALFLMLVVRPVAVFCATAGTSLTSSERLFLAWLAPRGVVAASVASIFALRLGDAGHAIVPAVFSVILLSGLIYGLTLRPFARALGISQPDPQGVLIAGAHAGARAIAAGLSQAGFTVVLVDTLLENIAAARLEGFQTYLANVLSPSVTDSLDLGGVGRFLALTRNEELNSLAALHFSEVFGRAEVYQIDVEAALSTRKKTRSSLLRGRMLFGDQVTYQSLDARFAEGWTIRTTKLTKEFDFEAYKAQHEQRAIVFFIVQEDGVLLVATRDNPRAPRAGQTVIGLVPPKQSEAATEKAD